MGQLWNISEYNCKRYFLNCWKLKKKLNQVVGKDTTTLQTFLPGRGREVFMVEAKGAKEKQRPFAIPSLVLKEQRWEQITSNSMLANGHASQDGLCGFADFLVLEKLYKA